MVRSSNRSDGPVTGVPIVGALVRRRSYRLLALLFLLFPIGVANFAILLTGIVLGVVLLPFVVGVPILGSVLVIVTHLGQWYGRLVTALSGPEIDSEGFTFGPDGFWAGLKRVATSPRPYLLVGCLFATFPLGLGVFVALAVWLSLSVAFLAAPILGPLPDVEYQFTATWVLDSPLEWVGASLVGAVSLVVGVWLFTLAGEGLARAAKVVIEFDGGSEIPADRSREPSAAPRDASQDR